MKFSVFVFASVLIVIVTKINGSTIPIIEDFELSKLKVESGSSNNTENNHAGHQHRKGRCFFSSPSGGGSSPVTNSWQGIPRTQNFGTRQGPAVGGYAKSIYPTRAYQPFTSYID